MMKTTTDFHDITEYNKSIGINQKPSRFTTPSIQLEPTTLCTFQIPQRKILNPAGQWNSSKIIFTPEIVEHWLNGELLLTFVPWSEEWNAKKSNGKWKIAEDYGIYKKGFIGFQDHGSPLWFRNIKIKEL